MQHYSGFGLFKHAINHHENWQRAWRSPKPKPAYDVIIVGGGGHGLATAYYLAKEFGITNVAVIEKGYLGSGNTARNTTIVRSNYLWDESAHLYEHSMKLWEGLSQDLNYNVMFSQRGVLNLGHSLQDMRDIQRRVNANRLNGIDGEVLDTQQVQEIVPTMDCSANRRYPVMGASWQPRGGVARHDAVAWGFARGADALEMAIWQRKPLAGLIHHSDRGSQYASKTFRTLLESHDFKGSMSRKGNCWDNAVAESVFGSLKQERVQWKSYQTRFEAQQDILNYISMFYNSYRLHSYLDYCCPNDFEEQLIEMKKVA